MPNRSRLILGVAAPIACLCLAAPCVAQVPYGVNASGELFRFSMSNRAQPVVPIGNLGFVPEGLDFRPGSADLYAIDIGPATSRLYTVNITTGASTPVGPAFPSMGTVGMGGASYNLTSGASFGFDFNPTTLQQDGSMRIRLISNTGQNLQLDSGSGQISGVDAALNYPTPPGGPPNVDAIAHAFSGNATSGGNTVLYGLDFGTDSLVRLNNPVDGTITRIGSFGLGREIIAGAKFNILSYPFDPPTQPGIAQAVVRLSSAPGEWLLFSANLVTGTITLGAPVGVAGGNPAADFTGGFAVAVPTPSTMGLAAACSTLLFRRRCRFRH